MIKTRRKKILVKIIDYFYYNQDDGPVLCIRTRDKNRKHHLLQIYDKEYLMPRFGLLKKEGEEVYKRSTYYFNKIKDAHPSLYGEEVVMLYMDFPWQVGKVKSDLQKEGMQTFGADIKWEKMAISHIIKDCKLEGAYIEVSDDYAYIFLTKDDIKPVKKEDFFLLENRICYWDIEADTKEVNSKITYQDYEKMPIISITTYDNYDEEYHEFVWHPDFKNYEITVFENYQILDNVLKDNVIVIEKIVRHECLTEKDMLLEFFKYFSNKKFDCMFGFFSVGGWNKIGGKKKWQDGFDMPALYKRAVTLGITEEMQSMSVCPMKYGYGGRFDSVYLRTSEKKHEVFVKGLTQIDYVFAEKILGFAQKYYDFRGHKLSDWARYFLGYNKLDKDEHTVYYYWEQSDFDEEDYLKGKIINNVVRIYNKGLEFMLSYNLIDVKICVDLDKKFDVTKKQIGRAEVAIAPASDGLTASKIHDHYKLTHYQDRYSFDSKYQNFKRKELNGKKEIGEKFTITLKDLEDIANSKGLKVKYQTLYDIHKVGGFVPKPLGQGIFKNIGVIDFSKFYPNMIKSTNAGIVSCVDYSYEDEEYVYGTKGNKFLKTDLIETPIAYFKKDVKSLNSEVFDRWMIERVEAQKKLEEYMNIYHTTTTDKYKLLWTEQFNIKNFMNAGFGVLGLPIDRAYSKLCFNVCTVSCYSDDTEILTKNDGWILFKNLTKDHKVACLSQEDHMMYWHKPSAIQKYHRKGEMIKIKQKSVDLLVTPDHKIHYVTDKYKRNSYLKEYKDLPRTIKFLNNSKWEGKEEKWFYLPKVSSYRNTAKNIEKLLMDKWLEFLGWFIAEGYTTKKSNGYEVVICQQKTYNKQEIRDVINNLGYNFYEINHKFRIHNKQLWSYLKLLGKAPEKYIPQEFMNLSKRQLQILFDAMMKGDGMIRTQNRTRSQDIYFTTSEKLANQVQEIIIKLGYNASIKEYFPKSHKINGKTIKTQRKQYRITCRKSVCHNLDKNKHFSTIDYDGMVYCCTVPEHIILVRRNKIPSWCGNCQDVLKYCIKLMEDELDITIVGGDSITKDRCIPIKFKDGSIDIIPIEELWLKFKNNSINFNGKERIVLLGEIETLSKNGEWKKVKELIRHKTNKKILRINQKNGETICTEDHSLIGENYEEIKPTEVYNSNSKIKYLESFYNLSKGGCYGNYYIDLYDILKDYKIEKEYKGRVKTSKWHLLDGDKLWFGWTNRKTQKTIKRFVRLEDLCKLLGIYVADGHSSLSCNRFTSGISTSNYKFGKEIQDLFESINVDHIVSLIESSPKQKRILYGKEYNLKAMYRVQCNSNTFGALFHFLCGSGAEHKKIPKFLFNIDRKYQKIFYDFYLKGDGCVEHKQNSFTTKSLRVVSGICYLLKSWGIDTNIYYSKKRDVYRLRERIKAQDLQNPIKTKIEEIKYKGYVYDLSVEDTEIFVDACGMLLLHNTDSMFIQLKTEGLDNQIKEVEDYCDYLNKKIDEYLNEVYNIQEHTILIGLETISDKFYVESKKHYIKRNLYAEGVKLDKPELEIKGMDLKKRATAKIGAELQEKIVDFIFKSKEPEKDVKEYIFDFDNNLKNRKWSEVCKRGPLQKALDSYPDSNETARAGFNTLKYMNRYYGPGSNPFLGVFKKYPPKMNGKFLSESGDFKMLFDRNDEEELKKLGFDLNWDNIREMCYSKTIHLLNIFNTNYYNIIEEMSCGGTLDI